MQETNLYHLAKFYVKKWPIILAFVAIGALIGWIYTSYIQKPLYKSDATLLLVSADRTASKDSTRINNYIELFKSRRVLEPVIQQLSLDKSYNDLASSVDAKNSKDTEVISVSISHPDRDMSKRIASAAIASFKKELKSIYDKDNVQVVDDASTPDKPYNVKPSAQITLSMFAGFFAAVIVLFFVYDYRMSRGQIDLSAKPKKSPRLLAHLTRLLTGTTDQKGPRS